MTTSELTDEDPILTDLISREASLIAQIQALTVDITSIQAFSAPEFSVPIRANVLNFNWGGLAAFCQFDVITMEYYHLNSVLLGSLLLMHLQGRQRLHRGVAIGYQQLGDSLIESLPIGKLQTDGFLFLWVINNKYTKAFNLLETWGYKFVGKYSLTKMTSHGLRQR